jgi:hypothetical protein
MARGKDAWMAPGWPWELELLAVLFVVIAIAVPYYAHTLSVPEEAPAGVLQQRLDSGAAMLTEQRAVLWAVAIIGMYIAHLVLAGASLDLISTPFTHLVTPLAFSMIAYYRLYSAGAFDSQSLSIISGSPWQIAMWVISVVLITFLVARLRMARCLLKFRDVKWDISVPTLVDKTYGALLPQFHPLVYAPRIYRVCDQGLLVEGWLYVMPIGFEHIQSIAPVNRPELSLAGLYLATSTRSMIKMELLEKASEPLFISPQHRDDILKYCVPHVARSQQHRATTHGGGGTRSRQTSGGARR